MNLQSNAERWLSLAPPKLIEAVKPLKHFKLATTTVEAVSPSLSKMGEGYLSETGDIEVFLFVSLDDQSKRVLASIVRPSVAAEAKASDDKGFAPIHTTYDEEAKELIAAFLCDFPNALFSVEGGLPLVMFLPEVKLKRYITLNNMIDAAAQNCRKMCVAVPGGKGKGGKDSKCTSEAAIIEKLK